jgi:hypothetical protein
LDAHRRRFVAQAPGFEDESASDRSEDEPNRRRHSIAEEQAEGKTEMIKPKRTAAEQVEDEAARRALNPTQSRQTISDHQAEPEFQENHKRLKADRLAREAKLKG